MLWFYISDFNPTRSEPYTFYMASDDYQLRNSLDQWGQCPIDSPTSWCSARGRVLFLAPLCNGGISPTIRNLDRERCQVYRFDWINLQVGAGVNALIVEAREFYKRILNFWMHISPPDWNHYPSARSTSYHDSNCILGDHWIQIYLMDKHVRILDTAFKIQLSLD